MLGILGDLSPVQQPFTSDTLICWTLSEIGAQQYDGRSTWQDLTFVGPRTVSDSSADTEDVDDFGGAASEILGLHIYMELPDGNFVQVKTGGFDLRSLLQFSDASARQGTLRFFSHARWTHHRCWPLDCAGIPEHSDSLRVIVIAVYADGSRVRHVMPRP